MPSLFTAPLEVLTIADVEALKGWPESMTAEFKREIPGRDGRPDAWVSGGKMEAHGRDRLFREIVALANSAGGHLVIGVDEEGGSPPTAAAIMAVPRCADLAERLLQAAQSIDPPIPLLAAHGIPTDGNAGVIVVRVPASRMAPHRSTDREIYVRRGSSSVPVSMREVRDMVLSSDRGNAAVEAMFSRSASEFRAWFPRLDSAQAPTSFQLPLAGFRVTAAPVGGMFDIGRLAGRLTCERLVQQFDLTGGSGAYAVRLPISTRPIIRGVQMRSHGRDEDYSFIDITADGLVSAAFRIGSRSSGDGGCILLSWLLGYALNVLRLVDFCRGEAGLPECEYALETELALVGAPKLELRNTGVGWDGLGEVPAEQLPMLLPRLPYGLGSSKGEVISMLANDFGDAGGTYRERPWKLGFATAAG